jgi:hypothetical protein
LEKRLSKRADEHFSTQTLTRHLRDEVWFFRWMGFVQDAVDG